MSRFCFKKAVPAFLSLGSHTGLSVFPFSLWLDPPPLASQFGYCLPKSLSHSLHSLSVTHLLCTHRRSFDLFHPFHPFHTHSPLPPTPPYSTHPPDIFTSHILPFRPSLPFFCFPFPFPFFPSSLPLPFFFFPTLCELVQGLALLAVHSLSLFLCFVTRFSPSFLSLSFLSLAHPPPQSPTLVKSNIFRNFLSFRPFYSRLPGISGLDLSIRSSQLIQVFLHSSC